MEIRDSLSSEVEWENISIIGKGGSSIVYKATVHSTAQLIAVKKIDTECLTKNQINGFRAEIETMRSLSHSNIIQYIGMQEKNNNIFILMEYSDRGSIRQFYQNVGPLNQLQVSYSLRQVLSGLQYLHSKGFAHRDIKCANCLLSSVGTVKLADFGASKRFESDSIVSGLKGTPHWMAPEVIKGTQMTTGWMKADVWSLGCTAVEMFTGKVPYSEYENPMTAMYKIASGEIPKIKLDPPNSVEISVDFLDYIQVCCSVNPSDRPSAETLQQHPFVSSAIELPESDYKGLFQHHPVETSLKQGTVSQSQEGGTKVGGTHLKDLDLPTNCSITPILDTRVAEQFVMTDDDSATVAAGNNIGDKFSCFEGSQDGPDLIRVNSRSATAQRETPAFGFLINSDIGLETTPSTQFRKVPKPNITPIAISSESTAVASLGSLSTLPTAPRTVATSGVEQIAAAPDFSEMLTPSVLRRDSGIQRNFSDNISVSVENEMIFQEVRDDSNKEVPAPSKADTSNSAAEKSDETITFEEASAIYETLVAKYSPRPGDGEIGENAAHLAEKESANEFSNNNGVIKNEAQVPDDPPLYHEKGAVFQDKEIGGLDNRPLAPLSGQKVQITCLDQQKDSAERMKRKTKSKNKGNKHLGADHLSRASHAGAGAVRRNAQELLKNGVVQSDETQRFLPSEKQPKRNRLHVHPRLMKPIQKPNQETTKQGKPLHRSVQQSSHTHISPHGTGMLSRRDVGLRSRSAGVSVIAAPPLEKRQVRSKLPPVTRTNLIQKFQKDSSSQDEELSVDMQVVDQTSKGIDSRYIQSAPAVSRSVSLPPLQKLPQVSATPTHPSSSMDGNQGRVRRPEAQYSPLAKRLISPHAQVDSPVVDQVPLNKSHLPRVSSKFDAMKRNDVSVNSTTDCPG